MALMGKVKLSIGEPKRFPPIMLLAGSFVIWANLFTLASYHILLTD